MGKVLTTSAVERGGVPGTPVAEAWCPGLLGADVPAKLAGLQWDNAL
ncbi:MAG: hypothetical protein ACP5I8_11305 [Phycisphaerae bacterium]